jgi:TPR repeat protein
LLIVAGVISLFVQFNGTRDTSSPRKISGIGCPHGLAEDMSTGRCEPNGKVSTTSYVSESIRSAFDSPELRQTYKIASWGGMIAQRTLASAYMIGEGVVMDKKRAFHWFRKAAVQGDLTSQYILSIMLARGMGATENKLEGIRWLKEAAMRNHAKSQAIYGHVLMKSNVIKRNPKEGRMWLERAKRNRAKQRLKKPIGA